MDIDDFCPPADTAAFPTGTQTPATTLGKTAVEKELRKNNFVRTFAGDENGSAIVRCLLAAVGDVTPQQLSEPSEVELEFERDARRRIVGDSLEEWKEAGYFHAATLHNFLQAAARHFKKSIVQLDLKKGVYTLRRFGTGGDVMLDDGDVTLADVSNNVSNSLLLERAIVGGGARKGEHFSPFLRIERPTTYEQLIELCSDGYGVTYDRLSYTAPALTKLTGKEPSPGSLLPVDHTHVVVTSDGLGLEQMGDNTRGYFSLLELTFREECERRERLNDIPQDSCVPFTTRKGVHATFLRRSLLQDRKEWARLVKREELDVRRKIHNLENDTLLRKCDLDKMKHLWSAGIQRCRSSGVLTFDPSIQDPEKLKNWNELTEELHKTSVLNDKNVQNEKKRKLE